MRPSVSHYRGTIQITVTVQLQLHILYSIGRLYARHIVQNEQKITLKHCALCFAILYRMKIKTCIRTDRQIDEQTELNEKTSTTKQCPRINNGNGKHWRRQGGFRGSRPHQWPGKKRFFLLK